MHEGERDKLVNEADAIALRYLVRNLERVMQRAGEGIDGDRSLITLWDAFPQKNRRRIIEGMELRFIVEDKELFANATLV